MTDKLDNVNIGNLYTENYLKNSGTISSPSWGILYEPKYRRDLTSQDTGVINDGVTDSSDVFEIIAGVSNDTVKPFNLQVSQGKIAGNSVIDKYGENSDIDTSSAPEDVTQIGGLYNYDANNTAPIISLISDNAADTQIIEVSGLDINGFNITQQVVLNGTTRVALTTPLWRVFRMANEDTADIQGTVYCYVGTGGVPSTTDTRAIIVGSNNQTLMSIYTIPLGKVGFLVRGEAGMTRNQSTGTVNVSYYSRRYGKVFKNKKDFDLNNQGSNIYQDTRSFPDIIPALTDIKITVNSVSANSTGVFATFDILLVDEGQFSQEYLDGIGQPSST